MKRENLNEQLSRKDRYQSEISPPGTILSLAFRAGKYTGLVGGIASVIK